MALTEIQLLRVTEHLGSEWETLATYLGISRASILEITQKKGDISRPSASTIHKILSHWLHGQPAKSNSKGAMISALLKCGRPDIADMLSKVTEENGLSNGDSHEGIFQGINVKDLYFHERIGAGATSTVYRVTVKKHDGTSFQAAAKRFNAETAKSSMFQREIKLLMDLKHENIIRYYGFVNEISPIILIEYAHNGSLHDYLRSKDSLHKDLIESWSKQAALAIQYLHERNVTHRDIKSPNFLITEENVLKLCDFGLSEIIEVSHSTEDWGTTRWMAPEIFIELKASKASDVYSYALVVFELWTCEIPFEGQTPTQIMWNVSKGKRPCIPNNVPDDIRDLLKRCWNGDRHQRPTIHEIVAHLSRKEPNEWALKMEFGKQGYKSSGTFGDACAVAVFPNGDIAVSDHDSNKIVTFTKDGVEKSILNFKEIWDIAVTSQGHLVMVDLSPKVKVVDRAGALLNIFTITQSLKYSPAAGRCVTVDSEDTIYVGDYRSKCIGIYTCNGVLLRKFDVCVRPFHVAVNKEFQILVSDGQSRQVCLYQPHGELLWIISNDKKGEPRGIACDDKYVYIACNFTDAKFRFVFYQIHEYDYSGRFLRCIAESNKRIEGIAYHNGIIYAATVNAVRVYSTQ